MHVLLQMIGVCLCTWLLHAHPDITAHRIRLSKECDHLEKCQLRQFPDSLENYNCHCGSFCSQLDTCCADSPFRATRVGSTNQRPVCRKIGGKLSACYFMVDKCPSNVDWNNIYQNLCEDESIENNNFTSVIPVTSLSTNMTYKNYFCLMCHEESTKYVSWTVKVKIVGKHSRYLDKNTLLKLRNVNNTWMAPVGEHGNLAPVFFTVDVPPELEYRPKVCIPDMVSSCSEKWPEDEIRRKCLMYMSATYIYKHYRGVWYRNPHCALCNYEDLKYAKCERVDHQIRLFSFTVSRRRRRSRRPFFRLIPFDTTERSFGERKNATGEKCEISYFWDPFLKKCRERRCALPGYVIKEGRCVFP